MLMKKNGSKRGQFNYGPGAEGQAAVVTYTSMPGVIAVAILDCSVHRAMEGAAASSSYRHSTKSMEPELAIAEGITLLLKKKKKSKNLQCCLLGKRENFKFL